jgi:hypothetical protein
MMIANDVRFDSEGLALAGTFCLPAQGTPMAATILLPGSGHHDRDETLDTLKPFAIIAEHLAKQGIASLRFDGRGMGESGGSTETVDFGTKVIDALAARRWIIGQAGFDAGRLAFIGHSEGGLVGAAAAGEEPTALAMLAGPAQPIADLLHSLAESQSRAGGATARQLLHERAMNEAAFAMAAALGAPDRDGLAFLIASFLSKWPDVDDPLPPDRQWETALVMAETLLAPDFRSLLQQQPDQILRRVRTPVLAMFGQLDCQVPAPPNAAAFLHATSSNRSAQIVTLEQHNHLFQVAQTGRIDEYHTLGASPSPTALAILSDWLHDTFG